VTDERLPIPPSASAPSVAGGACSLHGAECLRETSAELVTVPVKLALDVAEVARRLRNRPMLVALSGVWSGGSDVLATDPSMVETPDTADSAFEVTDCLPSVDGRESASAKSIGGGWFGYLGYGLANSTRRNPSRWPDRRLLRPAHWAYYDCLLRRDAGSQTWYFEALVSSHFSRREAEDRLELYLSSATTRIAPERTVVTVLKAPEKSRHVVAVEQCMMSIRRGDIFQANITTGLELRWEGSPACGWANLVEQLKPARAALVTTAEGAVVSASPELYLSRKGRHVQTAPIKGTRPLTDGSEGEQDKVLAQSTKDSAENVIIVDLMRNDLSTFCETGSVRVPAMLSVEPHAGVWHLVSRVEGSVAPQTRNAELLRGSFPPGSVTGAPKSSALEVMDSVEGGPRGVYTGGIGFSSPVAGLELNVAIRTFETRNQMAFLGIGGGVTVESTPVEEWLECGVKAMPILAPLGARWEIEGYAEDAEQFDRSLGLIETMLAVDGELLESQGHIGRLMRSLWEVYRLSLPEDILPQVLAASGRAGKGCRRIRVHAVPGAEQLEVSITIDGVQRPLGVCQQPGLAGTVVRTADVSPRHKYADRRWYEELEAHLPIDLGKGGASCLILADSQGNLLEGSRANIFVVTRAGLRTSPLDGRILPGVTRQAILDEADDLGVPVELSPINGKSIECAEGVFVVNALKGVQWLRSLGSWKWSAPDAVTRQLSSGLLRRWKL
jgi:para-aminobenzoate synthetase/4-amino-4-deoxychorismate lyase